jgi:hypothetical protein
MASVEDIKAQVNETIASNNLDIQSLVDGTEVRNQYGTYLLGLAETCTNAGSAILNEWGGRIDCTTVGALDETADELTQLESDNTHIAKAIQLLLAGDNTADQDGEIVRPLDRDELRSALAYAAQLATKIGTNIMAQTATNPDSPASQTLSYLQQANGELARYNESV